MTIRTRLLALFALLASGFAFAQTSPITLTGSPTTGILPFNITLTWTSPPEFTSCTATGAWSGAKPANGTQIVTAAAPAGIKAYGLDCTGASGTATASWTAPSLNVDGSPIPATGPGSLAGFKIFQAATSAGLSTATPVTVPGGAVTSYVFNSLPAGDRYFVVSAYNAAGIESALSNTANRLIVVPAASASASITVNVRPQAPVLTIATVAYELRQYTGGTLRFVQVGTVPMGAECGSKLVGEYAAFTGATLTKPTTGGIIAARCGS